MSSVSRTGRALSPGASSRDRSAAGGPAPGGGVLRRPLAPAVAAHPVPRPPLGPISRWVRRAERRLNQELGARLYPWIPGMAAPFSRQLERSLVLSEAEVPVPRLPPAFDGTTVLLMTDIHTGPFLRPAALARVFDRLVSERPDLILLGGDLTTGTVAEFEPFIPAFRRLRAPLGVWAVFGNHDYYSGRPSELAALLADVPLPLLHNRGVTLPRGAAGLRLAGLDDLHWGRPDLAAALAGPQPPHLLLSHNPDVFFDAAWRGVGLVLAGHTHGGQIRLPGLPILVKMSRYALDQGRFLSNGSQLVVSRGLGVTGVPLRWRCAPEAVWLTLRATGDPPGEA